MIYTAEELEDRATIHQGQCCDCKVDTGEIRVWVCRVEGGVTIEKYFPDKGHWRTVEGGCYE